MFAGNEQNAGPVSEATGRRKARRRDTSSSGEIRRQAMVAFIAFLVCVVAVASVIVMEISAHDHIRWENPANF